MELLGLAVSTVSRHLALLQQAGLVQSRRQGRWVYYQLAREPVPPVVREGLNWVLKAVASDPQIRADRRTIAALRRSGRVKPCPERVRT